MNKQSVSKLKLLLTGLSQRMTENIDYFKSLKIVYRSGVKETTEYIEVVFGKIRLNYMGKTEVIELAILPEKISQLAQNFDAVTVIYEERGTTLIIEADNKNVKMNTKEQSLDNNEEKHHEPALVSNRNYCIKIGDADSLLREIGILSETGRAKNDMIRKYNQIDHFVELLDPIIQKLCMEYDTINVIDCGCGKSYLTFVLNYYIKEVLKKNCYFIGLDSSDIVIEASKRTAIRLGYHNMAFKKSSIRDYISDKKIHLLISLHACDTATDEAIAVGVNNSVLSMVVVPCCHRELLNQYKYEPFTHILKHGVLKARMADILTDGMRALYLEALGYKSSIIEYISPLETPKNLMLRIEKVQKSSQLLMKDYQILKDQLGVSISLEKLISGKI